MHALPFPPHAPPAVSPLPVPTVPVRDEPAWEYQRLVKNLRTEDAPTADELNTLGVDGWELVGVFCDSPLLYLYLKRPS